MSCTAALSTNDEVPYKNKESMVRKIFRRKGFVASATDIIDLKISLENFFAGFCVVEIFHGKLTDLSSDGKNKKPHFKRLALALISIDSSIV